MAAFKQDFTIEQSEDCTTLTFTDISNIQHTSDNDEGYNYTYFTTKNIGVYDSTNTIIGSLIPIVDQTPVTFTLDKDRFLYIKETFQHNTDTPLIKQYDVALSCNVDLALGESIISNILDENGIGSQNQEDDSTLFNIIKTTLASKIFASRSNATLSQDMLDLANSYTDTTNTSLN